MIITMIELYLLVPKFLRDSQAYYLVPVRVSALLLAVAPSGMTVGSKTFMIVSCMV